MHLPLAEAATGPGPPARGGACAVVIGPWILASCILGGLGRSPDEAVVRVISSLYPSWIDVPVALTLIALALVLGLKLQHET